MCIIVVIIKRETIGRKAKSTKPGHKIERLQHNVLQQTHPSACMAPEAQGFQAIPLLPEDRMPGTKNADLCNGVDQLLNLKPETW